MNRVSATEASRNFSELLNRARYGGESFVVERNGEPVAEIRPVAAGPTLDEFLARLHATEPPDDKFADDMRAVMAEGRRDFPVSRWSGDDRD